MNVDTKEVYWDAEAVKQAEGRGERLMPLTRIGGARESKYSARDYDDSGRLLPRRVRRQLAKRKRV